MIVLDMDILSCFSKIRRFASAKSFKKEFCIPLRVYEELLRAKEKGYDFVDYTLKLIEEGKIRIELLDRRELDVVRELSRRERLGFSEIEVLALAKIRGWILLSDDKVNVRDEEKATGTTV
jgi:predicted nucleic acid-binding protein